MTQTNMPDSFEREFGRLLSDVDFIRKAIERLTLSAEVTERRLFAVERNTNIVTEDVKDVKGRVVSLEKSRDVPDETKHLTIAELLAFRQEREGSKERLDATIANRRSLHLLMWGFSLQFGGATIFMIIHIILNGGHP